MMRAIRGLGFASRAFGSYTNEQTNEWSLEWILILFSWTRNSDDSFNEAMNDREGQSAEMEGFKTMIVPEKVPETS